MSDDASGTASVANERLLSLLQGIQSKTRFDHPVARFQLIATHISYVLLTGSYAYKFKRPLDLGFLDFTTLILHVKANETTLRERILRRQAQDRDASEATVTVLDHQLGSREPLTAEEEPFAVTVDTDTDARVDPDWIWNQVSRWGTQR